MSLTINNNMMAYTSARYLSSSYNKLSDSTRKLSSGLRVDTAADDAAGLAIRELMRSDIAALNQGVRNANDGISLIQTADGALQVVDEKLIRMKELAEQAATGTYDSTQRLLIESEYQQMASEITRIANATDFNGIKLLDGTLSGAHDGSGLVSKGELKIHFGTGNDSAEDYYYIQIGNCTASALGLGNASTLDAAINWIRKNSLWPMPMGLSCCAIEFMAVACSRYDLSRFGSEVTRFSPRQADVMIVAGTVTYKMALAVRRIWDQMPEPKWCIAMGACASTGGMFRSYSVLQGVDKILPVDVYISGCPPRPEAILEALLTLRKKLDTQQPARTFFKKEEPREANAPVPVNTEMPLE